MCYPAEVKLWKHISCFLLSYERGSPNATYLLLNTQKETNVFLSTQKQLKSLLMDSILNQIKRRRLALGYKQHDMVMRVGMSRQQYQRLESRGNPRLETLELIAKGLNSELVLVPQEKIQAVLELLQRGSSDSQIADPSRSKEEKGLPDDPWQGLLGDAE